MMLRTGKQLITIHILPKISRSKGIQQPDKEIWSVNGI